MNHKTVFQSKKKEWEIFFSDGPSPTLASKALSWVVLIQSREELRSWPSQVSDNKYKHRAKTKTKAPLFNNGGNGNRLSSLIGFFHPQASSVAIFVGFPLIQAVRTSNAEFVSLSISTPKISQLKLLQFWLLCFFFFRLNLLSKFFTFEFFLCRDYGVV